MPSPGAEMVPVMFEKPERASPGPIDSTTTIGSASADVQFFEAQANSAVLAA